MSDPSNGRTTLTLEPIKLARIGLGGYAIRARGSIAAGSRLWLGLPDQANSIEVTGKPLAGLIDPSNLPQLLALIGKQKTLWGRSGKCQVFVTRGNELLAKSNVQDIACPVQPYTGTLSPALGKGDSGPPLRYTGTPPKYPDGRVFHVPPIDGCRYFSYGGLFETDDRKRGFNCITYVGAVFGVDAHSKAMSAYGTQLADHCKCTHVGCENQTLEQVRNFFIAHPRGTYLMWSAHHITIVVNATVHEFRERLNGYNSQPIAQWSHHDHHWWVRKAVRDFPN